MSQSIKIKGINIRNFKSLFDVSFETGNVNVFIGANGSGKTSVLEAIGVLSAAMTDRVNNNSLQRKGVRLSTSSLYKSKDYLPRRQGEATSAVPSMSVAFYAFDHMQKRDRYERISFCIRQRKHVLYFG